MRSEFRLTRLAALAAVALVLATAPACNKTDDPQQAEGVILVTSLAPGGLSVAAATDTTVTVSYTINARNDAATSFFHDITLNSYTAAFAPGVVASMSGAISTGYCSPGDTCVVTLTLVPNGSKPGAGTTVLATVDVEGRDVNDNPVNFSFQVPLTFVP